MSPRETKQRVEHELFLRSFLAIRPPPEVAANFAVAMRDVVFRAGAIIFKRGEPSGRLFFIAAGTVRLEAPDQDPWIFDDESLIGILDASMNRPHSRTAVAATDVHAITLTYEEYTDVLEDHYDYARLVLMSLCQDLHKAALILAPNDVFAPTQTPEGTLSLQPDRSGPTGVVERVLLLRNAPFFDGAPVQALAVLAGRAEERRYSDSTFIQRRGEVALHLEFIVSGEVDLERIDPVVKMRLGPVDLIGGHATLGHEYHQYDARAVGDVLTIRVLKEDLFDVAEDHSALSRCLYANLSRERERVQNRRATLDAQTRGEARGQGQGQAQIRDQVQVQDQDQVQGQGQDQDQRQVQGQVQRRDEDQDQDFC